MFITYILTVLVLLVMGVLLWLSVYAFVDMRADERNNEV